MRLGAKLLNNSATLNQFNYVDSIKIAQNETVDIFVQLVDQDQNGLRYVPAIGSSVQFQIGRSPLAFPDPGGSRTVEDFSISRAMINPFPLDSSIWKVTILPTETATMISSGIRLVLTENGIYKIATINQAIKMIDNQDY